MDRSRKLLHVWNTAIGDIFWSMSVSPDGRIGVWVGADVFEVEDGERYPTCDLRHLLFRLIEDNSGEGQYGHLVDLHAATALRKLSNDVLAKLDALEEYDMSEFKEG